MGVETGLKDGVIVCSGQCRIRSHGEDALGPVYVKVSPQDSHSLGDHSMELGVQVGSYRDGVPKHKVPGRCPLSGEHRGQ